MKLSITSFIERRGEVLTHHEDVLEGSDLSQAIKHAKVQLMEQMGTYPNQHHMVDWDSITITIAPAEKVIPKPVASRPRSLVARLIGVLFP